MILKNARVKEIFKPKKPPRAAGIFCHLKILPVTYVVDEQNVTQESVCFETMNLQSVLY